MKQRQLGLTLSIPFYFLAVGALQAQASDTNTHIIQFNDVFDTVTFGKKCAASSRPTIKIVQSRDSMGNPNYPIGLVIKEVFGSSPGMGANATRDGFVLTYDKPFLGLPDSTIEFTVTPPYPFFKIAVTTVEVSCSMLSSARLPRGGTDRPRPREASSNRHGPPVRGQQ